MKKYLPALLIVLTGAVHSAWIAVWAEPNGGGTIYYENSTMQFSGPVTPGTNPFIRATIHTNYQSSINSDKVCYPSANDCQWKRLNVTVTYDWSCNNVVRLVQADEQWDSGPTSQSYDPRTGYTIPEPRVHVPAPGPTPPGGTYNISNEPGFLAAQAQICQHWPR